MRKVFVYNTVLVILACLFMMPGLGNATVYAEYEVAGTETAYHTNTTINSRRTDHFLTRFGNQPREGYIQEHVFQGHLQFMEHVYDQWQLLGLRELGGTDATKYKSILKPHATWDWDPTGGAVGFSEGPMKIPGTHIPCNALNYTTGNGCTPHEFGHGWSNQGDTPGGLPSCQPQGFTESLANWIMCEYLGDYPAAWPAVGATYGHAMIGYNCMSIFNYFMEAPGYGAAFINKLIFDANLNSGSNYAGDDIVLKAIRCDTSGAVDKAGAIRDGLGMMNAKMLDMDFWNHRFDRTYGYNNDTDWSFYQWTRIPMVKQPGATGYYRPEWLCTPQQSSNSYIPLTITDAGSPRTVTCDFRPVSDAVRGSIFRACFVAFNANKEPRYSKLWNAGEKTFALADDETSVYLAVYAVPKAWNTGYMSNDYIADNVVMMPYLLKFTGATPKAYQWADPGVAHHAHSNGGGYVADTATVDASAYVGTNARVLGTAKVYGYSRIEDYAVVAGNATIGRSGQSDNPVISGHAYVTDNAQVYGHAKVRDYGWVWNSASVYGNAIVMAHTMLSGGSAYDNAILNQCPMRDTGLSFNGTFSGNVIRGGDNSGGGTYTQGVYAKWENPYTGDNKYQYLGYNFEKKSAIFAMDQYGLNHSFLMNDPQVVSDTVNSVTTNVLSFNGTNQYVELKPEAVGFADMSISAWVKWTGSANDQRIFSTGDGSTKYMYLTPKDASTSKLRFVISNGSTTQYIDGAAALTASTWTHVAITLSGNTGTLYVNGTQVGQNTGLTINPDQLHAALMEDANYIGRGNSGNYFAGRIDEFEVYNKALTSTEVTTAKNDVLTGTAAASDTTAPTPATSTWVVNPVAAGDNAITMVATDGTDAGGNGVLYYFRCVTDSTHDSGWVSDPKFTDAKCTPGTSYTYAVKMKDKLGNTGTESSQLAATALAADTTAPTPNPPTFASAPKGDTTTSITMTATKATDVDELVMYKFSRVGGTANSGWTSSCTWTDTGLTSGSSYSYTLQVKDAHGNTTSTATSASTLARDDSAPIFDSPRRMQWDTEPYVRLDKTVRMSCKSQIETAVDYYFECVENTSLNSGWISAKEWVTPAMADGTFTFHFKIRDRSAQLNQTAWSNTSQAKVLTTNCYHDYSLTQLSGLADSTLVRFTGNVTTVNAGSYVVSTSDGLTSITVLPHTYNYVTDTTLLNQSVTVKGHLWTYNGGSKIVTYAYVLGNPASGKLEFEDGDPIGASTNEAAPYYDPNASGLLGLNGWWTDGDAVEFPNVAAASEMSVCYACGGDFQMALYINGTFARNISFPSTGGTNIYGYAVQTGLSIPSGATIRFQRNNGQNPPNLDYVIMGSTYTVSGTVTDASAGNAAVSGAKVYISPATGSLTKCAYTAISDASGNYSLRLPAGTWYAAAAYDAEVRVKSSGEQSFTTGPNRTGINFSINWMTARSGKIEAETARCFGGTNPAVDATASGNMAVVNNWPLGSGIEFSNVAAASQVTLSYGYCYDTTSVYVNGVHTADLYLPYHTGNYGEVTFSIAIPDHATLRFQHDTDDRDTNFDYIIVGTAPTTYTVTASAGTGGTISPTGAVSVTSGANQTFAISANTGYAISNVTVDGASQGAISSYTFNNVTANHTISATFTAVTYTITASAGTGGSISPSGAVSVNYGANQSFTVTPDTGYTISDVTVDSVSQGAISTYQFTNVTATHTIAATFTNSGRNIPQTANLLKSAITETFPASGNTGNWASYMPASETYNTMATPTVDTIGGVKWEQNLNADYDGYDCGTYSSSIACNGASIVVAVKPTRTGTDNNWQSVVDVFYDRLVLGVMNGTGRVCVRRNGSLDWSTATIPDGQITILSLVAQSTGTYKVFANGTEIMNNTNTSALTTLVPNVPGPYANHINIGRNNPDGWTTFNGHIGDVFLYKVALSDTDRQTLEADLTSKFVVSNYTITASAGTGGSISPSGAVSVVSGANQSFTIAPSVGYAISQVTVDGVNQGAISSYQFTNVTANHTIAATFSQITYTITASAGTGGSISPSGAVSVNYGANQSFTITPNAGYAISQVTVDGVNQGAVGTYQFTNVTATHTISATFSQITYTITASAGTGGSISPSGAVSVNSGANQTFTITPTTGYTISAVTVDSVSQGAISTYTFNNVVAAHTISATFTSTGRNIPQTANLIKSAVTDTFPTSGNTGNWASYLPAGATYITMATPVVETLSGTKWEQNLRADMDGYDCGTYSSSIACNGASIVVAVKPTRTGTDTSNWQSVVDVFYDRLVLGVMNADGRICVRRNGSLDWSTATIPDGQKTVLSLVVQSTGTYKVFANGTEVMNNTNTSTLTSLVPSVPGAYANHINIGRNNPDGWTTYNGNIGDVFLYNIALSDADRATLEADLTSKFIQTTYTITASAGTGGSISPSGAVSVNPGADQNFTFTASAGYGISDVIVDGVSQGIIASYQFTNVTAAHTIAVSFIAMPTPTAFYQFENNVTDTQGSYNGTAYNTPTYVAGRVGSYAIQFNGTNQYVRIARPVSTNFTFAFFVKTTQTSLTGSNWYNGSGMVDGEVAGTTNDFGISYLNSKVAFGVGNVDTTIQSTSTINTGNWVHVACTRDSTTGQMKIYINGTLQTTGTGPTGTKSAATYLRMGCLQTNTRFFNGAIDQLKIYSSVLTAEQIAALAGQNGLMSIGNTSRPIIDLNAVNLQPGLLNNWSNTGSLGGEFTNDDTAPVVQNVDGKMAVTFDGDDLMKASFLAPSSITGSKQFTTVVWAYSSDIDANGTLFSWSTNAQCNFANSAGIPGAYAWHMITTSYDGSNVKYSVDGVLWAAEAKTPATRPGLPVILGSAYTVSGSTYYPTLSFIGSVGMVKVYDRALNANEINMIYNAGF